MNFFFLLICYYTHSAKRGVKSQPQCFSARDFNPLVAARFNENFPT
jgi:hypothetical protein